MDINIISLSWCVEGRRWRRRPPTEPMVLFSFSFQILLPVMMGIMKVVILRNRLNAYHGLGLYQMLSTSSFCKGCLRVCHVPGMVGAADKVWSEGGSLPSWNLHFRKTDHHYLGWNEQGEKWLEVRQREAGNGLRQCMASGDIRESWLFLWGSWEPRDFKLR